MFDGFIVFWGWGCAFLKGMGDFLIGNFPIGNLQWAICNGQFTNYEFRISHNDDCMHCLVLLTIRQIVAEGWVCGLVHVLRIAFALNDWGYIVVGI